MANTNNVIGLGLIVVGVIFMVFLGLFGIIVGLVCLLVGIGLWWLNWQRRRRAAT